jgi:hypothetical protein
MGSDDVESAQLNAAGASFGHLRIYYTLLSAFMYFGGILHNMQLMKIP